MSESKTTNSGIIIAANSLKNTTMKKYLLLPICVFILNLSWSQCTFNIVPFSYVQVSTNSTVNGTGTNYWICSGLTVTIASSQGDNYVCENNVTLNINNSAGDNVYAKPGCIINNNSSQDITVVCDPTTVTLNNNGSGSITIAQVCTPVIYDYSLVGGAGSCGATNIGENEISKMEIYPNPFSSETILQLDNQVHNATLFIYDMQGQMVQQINNIMGQQIILSRNNLENGIYFIQLTEENTTIATDKLVIVE